MKKISTKNTLIGIILIPAMFSGAVLAHETGDGHDDNTVKKAEAYGVDGRGEIWRNTTGLCWRTGYWTPAMAIHECDPDLVKKPEVVAAAPAPAPAPAPAAPHRVTFSADALFDFDSANLKPQGIQSLNEFARGMQDIKYSEITVVGHADRIGSDQYNKALSLRRAKAVKAHLVSRGIGPERIKGYGEGEANPVTGNRCVGNKTTKALIDCLAPDRRVDIEVIGSHGSH
jgi:OOP family OmpA-OmpF porin